MLTKSDNYIHIDHVMWEPIFNCVCDCDGCYISASPSSKYSGPINTDLLDILFNESNKHKLSCDQLTVSLNTLTSRPSDVLINKLKWLWNLYNTADDCGCVNTRKLINNKPLPALCVTAFNFNTINKWAEWLELTTDKFLSPLYILSLSNFPVLGKICQELKDLCKSTKTILNFNKMCEKNIQNTKSFEMGIRYSDQTYLVLKKPALGNEVSEEDVDNFIDILTTTESDNLVPDVCMVDSRNFLKSGRKCGAGITKIHVWPDNSVTGCPYDSQHRLDGHYGSESKQYNLWEQVKLATMNRSCHSMDLCKIPTTLKQIQKRNKLQLNIASNQ